MRTQRILDAVRIDIDDYLSRNPIHHNARSGAMDEAQTRRLVIAKFQALQAETTSYGLLVQRYRDPVPVGYFSHVIHRLTASYPYLDQAARALGLDPAELPRQPVHASLRRLAEWLAWVGLYAGAGEAALAVRVDFGVWGSLTGALADALRELDAPQPVIEFLEFESAVPQEITDGAVPVVEYGLAHGEDPSSITRSALEVVSVQGPAWEYVREG
ncbi:hypothetical protein [Streptomyces fradiae]|uniref:hypothetical protein n=1 Tax=Streptomyces fradiae TaxID=1906 RepID=UPI003410BC43